MTSRSSIRGRAAPGLVLLGALAGTALGMSVAAVPAIAERAPAQVLRALAAEKTGSVQAVLQGEERRPEHAAVPVRPSSESVVIYDNTTGSGTDYYRGQAGQEAIDDIHAAGSGYLRRIAIEYVEPNPFASGLEARVTVYDNPWGLDMDLVRVAGPYVVTGLLPGRHVAYLDVFDWVEVGSDLWIGVQFTTRSAGLMINDTPTVGSSHDYYLENGNSFFFGGHPKANFSLRVEVGGPPQALSFDIHPRSCPNPINVKSGGDTPAALLGTAEVDVRQVDVSSVRLEGVAPVRFAYEDVATPASGEECSCTTAGKDRFEDLTLKFDTQELVTALGNILPGETRVLHLVGWLVDGTPFVAQDCIVIKGLAATGVTVPTVLTVLTSPLDRVQELEYEISERSRVSLSIYDVRGRIVQDLVREVQSAGTHVVRWDAGESPGGVYFCRLRVGESIEARKVVVIR